MLYKAKLQTSVTDHPPQPNIWEVRDRAIEKRVSEYMAGFSYRDLASEASRGGWDLDLLYYVRHVATIQAQIIEGAQVGYNSGVLFGYGSGIDKRDVSAWLDDQRKLCADGTIDIRIPTKRIDAWKSMNEWRKGKAA